MQPEKSQLDTLEFYLKKIVSGEKAKTLVNKFKKADESKANQAIKLFETRSMARLQDIERILGGS